MFNVRRNKESKEQKAVVTESVPALDVENLEEGRMENRKVSDENVSLLRREDMQQPARPGQGGALLGRGCRFDGKLTFICFRIHLNTVSSSSHLSLRLDLIDSCWHLTCP